MLHYRVRNCRVRSLVGNARQEIVVETEDGSTECEAKLLHLKTTRRSRTTETLKGSQITGSRIHRCHLQLVNNLAFWDCRSVAHSLLVVLASTWAKPLVCCVSVGAGTVYIYGVSKQHFNTSDQCYLSQSSLL